MMTFAQLGRLSLQMQMLYVQGVNSGSKPDDPVELPNDDLTFSVSEFPETPTIKICAEAFLNLKKYTVRQSTYHRYIRCFRNSVLPFFGDMQLNAVSGKVVQEFVNAMLRQGMNPKAIKYCVTMLKSVLLCAEADGIITMPAIRPNYPKQCKQERPILSDEDFDRLSEDLLQEDSSIATALLIVMHTGIRLGEACALQWSDVDFKTNSIYIRHSVKRYYIPDEKRTVCELGEPKTPKSKRRIYVSQWLTDILKERQGTGFICTGADRFCSPETMRNTLNRRLKQLNIPHIRFHDLRHGFATRAINGAGVDPKTVAEILGHEHCDITLDIYTSCTAQMQIEAMEQIQKMKGG
ncbi:MAG: site-specific integrase [Oscillospiraceae bacterium]|nr:site-specific integrase [Oscillospiraceae bacterium]